MREPLRGPARLHPEHRAEGFRLSRERQAGNFVFMIPPPDGLKPNRGENFSEIISRAT
jgi:hypothetical protein